MKKIMILFAVIMLLFLGCNAEDDRGNGTEIDSGEAIGVDKGLFDVKITLPASMFEPDEIEEIVASAKERGVKDVVVNDDGSVTYKMSKSTHNKMMEELTESLIESLEEMKSSGDFTSIRDTKYNKDFTQITLVVNTEAFENSFDAFAILGVGMLAMYYQLFDGVGSDNLRATVNVEDEDTGEIFSTVVYPDAFDNEKELSVDITEFEDLDFGTARSSITINRELWETSTIYADSFRGEYIITLIEKQKFISPIKSSYGFDDVTARGKFIGIKYEIQNNTDNQIQPAFHFNDLIVATDGIRKWHPHYEATSEISYIMGGLTFAGYLGAGFSDTSWVVFDIPIDAEVVGLIYEGSVSSQKPIPIKMP